MPAYYNEIDPYAAAWLRNLIAAGHIAPGEVDTRSIKEVSADDLRGFEQAHFFAGIGGWSLAFRLAGWPDDEPVWTGSCPCQPFSAAGKRKGTGDERHLWPEFLRLIAERRPTVVFGEQVASADGRLWLAGVRADVEALGYAIGAADLCAAGAGEEAEGWLRLEDIDGTHEWVERIVVGAPHIRQRLFWVADAAGARRIGAVGGAEGQARDEARLLVPGADSTDGRLADADRRQRAGLADGEGRQHDGQAAGWDEGNGVAEPGGSSCGLADAGRRSDERGLRPAGAPGAAGPAEGEAWQSERCGPDAGGCGSDGRLADAEGAGLPHGGAGTIQPEPWAGRSDGRLADAHGGEPRQAGTGRLQPGGQHGQQQEDGGFAAWIARTGSLGGSREEYDTLVACGWLEHPDRERRDGGGLHLRSGRQDEAAAGELWAGGLGDAVPAGRAEWWTGAGFGQTAGGCGLGGAWSDFYLVPCIDGKARRVGSGLFPLAHGVPNRVGRLRAYGNAIVPQVAAEFVRAWREARLLPEAA